MKAASTSFTVLLLFFLGTLLCAAQGDRCSSIQPFCAGDSQLIFPNSNYTNSDQVNAEPGPDYRCLATQPYPAWFYLKIEEAGDLEFTITQSENPDGSGDLFDVDFIVWGPFTEDDDYCSGGFLNAGNAVDCSYDSAAVERMTIRGARANEIYVVLLTNYSSEPGYISLQQTNSAGGSTNCSIVGSALGPDLQICGDEPVVLDATNPQATEYRWYIYNEESGAYDLIPGETGPTLTVVSSGNYQVTVYSEELEDEASDNVQVDFYEIPVAREPSPVYGCSFGGDFIYDLTSAGEELTGNRIGDFNLKFYISREDYEEGNFVENPRAFTGEDDQLLLASIEDNISGCESDPVEVRLRESEITDLNIASETVLCLDSRGDLASPVRIGKDLGPDYLYEWTPANDQDNDGVQEPVFVISEIPEFSEISLRLTDVRSGCSFSYVTRFKQVSSPERVEVEIAGSDFDDTYTVTAKAIAGPGEETDYEYLLDNGNWRTDPVFTSVTAGTHNIAAREINGCGGFVVVRFRLIGYPRFFTPNSDGYNDMWNVINDAERSITKVFIFDRYGKLLKQINPASGGWDGTFNGREMPADDYWFLLEYREEDSGELKEFRGHFSLIRK